MAVSNILKMMKILWKYFTQWKAGIYFYRWYTISWNHRRNGAGTHRRFSTRIICL